MRTTKIWNISLPPEMARAAEKTAKKEARTKSELIREALRQYLWGRRRKELRRYGGQKAGERIQILTPRDCLDVLAKRKAPIGR